MIRREIKENLLTLQTRGKYLMKKKVFLAAVLAAGLTLTSCGNSGSPGAQLNGGSADEASLPDVPNTIVDGKLDADKSYTVRSGDVLRVSNGEPLLINGRLLCNNG